MTTVGMPTDLYEFTMAAGYHVFQPETEAVFELYAHTLPPERSFLVACGLEDVCQGLEAWRFSSQDVAYLKSLPVFQPVPKSFFRMLTSARFTGDVMALPEGTVCFAGEPILQVKAPLWQAQLLETWLLSVIHVSTLIASKAARVVLAASGDGRHRPVVDFGARRAHGPQAGVAAARAAYIAGCAGTSNVLAGKVYDIPVFGTMAHSWVQSFRDELDAFQSYQKLFPEKTILLVDTYDPEKAVMKALDAGLDFQAVRLDSGSLLTLSRRLRRCLDQRGRTAVKILASGNLNETKIAALVNKGAPIDLWGVGTDMVVSRDAPTLDLTYKLVEIRDRSGCRYTTKLSPGKHILPGQKQVFRQSDAKGRFRQDWLGRWNERGPRGTEPLLGPVMKRGKRRGSPDSLPRIRARVQDQIRRLPPALKALTKGPRTEFPVRLTPSLQTLDRQLTRALRPPARLQRRKFKTP